MQPDILLLWYVAFVISVVCHEAAHAAVALRGGDTTARRHGQVTLDPWPHIRREPLGMVIVPLLTMLWGGGMFGWGSTPYDPAWAERHPRRAALMALAGPAANAALALLAGVALRAGLALGAFRAVAAPAATRMVAGTSPSWSLTATGLSIAFSLNVGLCALNLLPLPPLDGGEALLRLLPAGRLTRLWRSPVARTAAAMAIMRTGGALITACQQAAGARAFGP